MKSLSHFPVWRTQDPECGWADHQRMGVEILADGEVPQVL